MCVDNAGAYDPRNPATDRRLTMYWIGWVFFGITITSIFIAGVMVSMYKMNIQDSKARSSGEIYDENMNPEDYEDASKDEEGKDGIGDRNLSPRRKPARCPPAVPKRGSSRPTASNVPVTYNVTNAHPKRNGHDVTSSKYDHIRPTFTVDDVNPNHADHGS